MSDLADLMQDILGCVPGKGDCCLIHGNGWPCDEWVDAQSRVQAWHEDRTWLLWMFARTVSGIAVAAIVLAVFMAVAT